MRRQAFLPEPRPVVDPGRNLTGLYLGQVLAIDAAAGTVAVELLDGARPVPGRMMVPSAAPGTGFVWLPRVGDLVVVGFLHGNNGMPVVLGALHALNDALPSQHAGDMTLLHPSGTSLVIAADGTLTLTQASGSFVSLAPSGDVELKDLIGGADVKLAAAGLTLSQAGATAEIRADGSIILTPAVGGNLQLGGGTTFVARDGDATSSPLGGSVADHYHIVNSTSTKVLAG